MPDSSADRDPLDRLAEEFVARLRAGEHPSVAAYADLHPGLADQIRDLFPALVEVEQLKPVTADLTHAGDIVGPLRYLAPERFDEQGDHRADVYTLDLTLYELLTLRPAFAAEGRAKLV